MDGNVSKAERAAARRARILDYLAGRPDRTVHEICVALGFMRESGRGCTGGVLYPLRRMEQQGLVMARAEFRAAQGRQVRLWRTAPAGTVLPRRVEPRTAAEHRRERARMKKRREQARAREMTVPAGAHVAAMWPKLPVAAASTLPSGAACQDVDPQLFFPEPGERDDRAKAICAVCPVRAECLAVALANGERHGVWGGINLETREHAADGVA